MAIIEKKVIVSSENAEIPNVERIENAIKEAGLEPVRWAIVDVIKNDYIILANGTEIQI
ncbi:MAG: hypothetical protein OSJ27_08465 [Candidatus Gastranaerophilales bacterium]|nr:hypothetical protein [Candidatus Gastranaerophilales bacterium]